MRQRASNGSTKLYRNGHDNNNNKSLKGRSLWSSAMGRIVMTKQVTMVLMWIICMGLSYMAGTRNALNRKVKSTPPHHMSIKIKKPKKFTPVPEESRKLFYTNTGSAINKPIARALRMRGWRKTDDFDKAQVLYSYSTNVKWMDKLQPWQRFNHIPNHKTWNHKDAFAEHMNAYRFKTKKPLPALPETYRLHDPTERKMFAKLLQNGGGLDRPWVLKKPTVNQGKGITMLGPNSKELERVVDFVEQEFKKHGEAAHKYIIQSYICNEMTFNHRKFDFRVFWLVASIEPLIVLYHDGYARLGNSEYNEQDFSNTVQHLTTHTGLAEEGKGTWAEFGQRLEDHKADHHDLVGHIVNPLQHVKNQVKQAIAEMAAAFKDIAYKRDILSSENGFSFNGADFIIDRDMDVWFIEPQSGCGLDEDFQFRIDMHNSLFTGMIDVIEEIQESQERREKVMELKNMGNWEVVYAEGSYSYEYEGYERSDHKAGCDIAGKTGPADASNKQIDPDPDAQRVRLRRV